MHPTVDSRPSSTSRLKGPRLSRYLKASAMAGAAAAPVSVLANFSGSYDVTPPPPGVYFNGTGNFGNWTGSVSGPAFPTLDTTGAPNQITLDLNQADDQGLSAYTFLTTAAATGLVSFNYATQFNTPGNAYFVVGNSLTPLVGSGPFSAPVTAGDMFGFELTTGYIGSATLTISSFSAPEPAAGVPDNGSTLALLAFGFVGLLALREKVQPAT